MYIIYPIQLHFQNSVTENIWSPRRGEGGGGGVAITFLRVQYYSYGQSRLHSRAVHAFSLDQHFFRFLLLLPIESNGNIDKRHQEKSNKYAHFGTDMTGYDCAVTAFEIGSRGYISTRNHSALYTLHKFVKPGVKLAKFKQNISALSVYSSFHIFITRKEAIFTEPPYLLPPFDDQWLWISMKHKVV